MNFRFFFKNSSFIITLILLTFFIYPINGEKLLEQPNSFSLDVFTQVPNQWQANFEQGTYYDPVTKSTWIFNPFLRKFYCPDAGWYLVSLFSSKGIPVYQYYYSPKGGNSIDPSSGDSIISNIQNQNPNTNNSGFSPEIIPNNISQNFNNQQGLETETQQIQGESNYDLGQSTQDEGLFEEIPCPLIKCSSCTTGDYCSDCNNDGKCDLSDAGGLSEEAQSSMYHVPKILSSTNSCPIIPCKENQGCLYCQDCNGDGVCESDIPPIIICSKSEKCSESGYCWDTNYDGICDSPLTTSQ